MVTAPQISEAEARSLAEAINQAAGTRPAGEVQKLVEMALARAPGHPLVLNSAGGYLQRGGRPAEARALYQRALAADPRSKVLWLNLAGACRSVGDTAAESQALEQALALEPRYVAALLQKADLQERLGRPKAAVQMFEAALHSIPPGEPAPPHMATAVAHAREVVAANSRALEAFIERELEPIRRQYSAADQLRYDACQDVLLGKRRAYSSLPKDTFFPYLPAIEFFPRESSAWLSTLEEATEDIAAEASAALQQHWAEFSPYVNFPAGTPIDNWGPLNHSRDWSVYSLWHDGAPLREHQAACPKTTAVLAQLPLCDVPGYAPGAFFSVLQPHTHLPPHTGTTNTRSIVHLPLVIPEGCRFRVGAQTRAWKKGQAWVFDDTIEHEAWNDSEQVRIILIFDIWNPLLTSAERDLVRAMTVARGRFYGADAPTMGSR
jgi:aspartate beta-hydroxylase